MGVPGNTIHFFLLYQILLFGSIGGLPFASIASLQSLQTSETASNEELSPDVSNLVSTESLASSSSIPGSSTTNYQLIVGLPIGNTNYFLSSNPFLIEQISDGISSDTSSTNVPTSLNIRPNTVSEASVSEPSRSSKDIRLDVIPSVTSTTTSIPGLSVAPVVNSHNFKRELRDTMSMSSQPCFSVTQENLARLTSNCVSNFPSPVFPSMSSLPNIKPMFPCGKMPVDATRPSTFSYFVSSSEDTGELSNGIESECILSSPFQSTITTKVNSNQSFQNNVGSQDNSNMLLALNLLNKRVAMQNSGEMDSPAQFNSCSESSETIISNPTSTAANNALSSFTEIKNYIDSKQTLQSDRIQNQLNIQTKISPSQLNRLNNNLMNAQVPEIGKVESQISQSNNIDCENTNSQDSDLKTEYENVLRIRNSVIPKMLSNNVRVKSIPKDVARNNNVNNDGCPQLETISFQDNKPCIQNDNIIQNPTNDCESENGNSLENTATYSFNNLARMIKHNLNDNECNGITVENNINLGCPQLTSIPVYNRELLLNKQLSQINNIDVVETLQKDCVNVNNNNLINLNQNIQGCPQLLSIAQNSLYTKKNNEINDACINAVGNVDCNCIQTSTPNDNLAQALKMVNRAKTANTPASTINILPYGEALLDGKPMSNNYISPESISCPAKLPTCACSNSNSKKFLTIKDVSSMPFPASPANSFSCSTPPIPTNVKLAPNFNPVNTESPIFKNIAPSLINLTPSVPTMSPITNTELANANSPLILSQESSFNSNIQPMFTLLSPTNSIGPIVTPNYIPVQSLPQVSFVNNLPYNCISNLPSVYNSIQPVVSSSYPLVRTNLQPNGLPGASSVFPSLNNVVSSLTQNIISTLMPKTSSGSPLAKLPPVNPFSSMNSPGYSDISGPSNYIVSTPLNLPGLSVPSIPVACNEYLPPMYNSGVIPISTFNSDLFYIGSDTDFDCGPFALSTTDAFYPEISFMLPTVGSSDTSRLCGSLFVPASSLPQSPSVVKINNTGREAQGFEQLLKSIVI